MSVKNNLCDVDAIHAILENIDPIVASKRKNQAGWVFCERRPCCKAKHKNIVFMHNEISSMPNTNG